MNIEGFTPEFKQYVLNEIDPLLKVKTPLYIARHYTLKVKRLVELSEGKLSDRLKLRQFLEKRRYQAKKFDTVTNEMFDSLVPDTFKTHQIEFKSGFAKKIETLLEATDEYEEELADNIKDYHEQVSEEIDKTIKEQSEDINKKINPMAVGMSVQSKLIDVIASQLLEQIQSTGLIEDYRSIETFNKLLSEYSNNLSMYNNLKSKELYNISNVKLDAQDKMFKQREQHLNLIMKKAMIYYKTAAEDKQALLKDSDMTIEETEESKRKNKLIKLLEVKGINEEENESVVELDS